MLFSLLLAEEACRVLYGNPPDLLDKSDPVLGSRYLRNAVAERRVDGRRVPVTINSEGFHSPEFPGAPTAGTTRLLFLGDSFTAATEVPLAETFAQQTAALLTAQGRPAEAINLGISGFNTAQELLCWRTIGAALQPDWVVLAFFAGNDLADNVPEFAPPGVPCFAWSDSAGLVPLPFTPRWSHKPNLLRQSALYKWEKQVTNRWLRRVEEGRQVLPRFGAYQPPTEPVWQRSWAVTEALLEALGTEVHEAGARLLLFLIPEQLQLDDAAWQAYLAARPAMASQTWDRDYPYRRLRGFAADHGLPVVDATEPFRAGLRREPLYNVEDAHWNPAGHRLAAHLLAAALADFDDPPAADQTP